MPASEDHVRRGAPHVDTEAIGEAAAAAELEELRTEVASLRAQLSEAERLAVTWRAELIEAQAALSRARREHFTEGAELLARLRANERQVRNLDELLMAMEGTVSWRLTSPLRTVRRLSNRNVGTERSAPTARDGPVELQPDPAVPPTASDVAGLVRRLHATCGYLDHGCQDVSSVVDVLTCFEMALAAASLPEGRTAWLAVVAGTGTYPDRATWEGSARALRRAGYEGLCQFVQQQFVTAVGEVSQLPDVEFLSGAVLVDITHTAMYDLHTGIQRVTRECASRWLAHPEAALVHFDEETGSLKRLSDDERQRAVAWRDNLHMAGREVRRRRPEERNGKTLVPFDCVHVIPELVDSVKRTERYAALRASAVLAGQSLIGYDLIPITAAEHTAPGVAEAFAHYISLVKQASVVAAISHTTGDELRAFSRALSAQGLDGPRIVAVPLPAGTVSVQADELELARRSFHVGTMPLVLVVGSHEPRKNHLRILEAAERLWRRGHRFDLLFVGGASWGRADFRNEVARLVGLHYPLQVRQRVDESSLWALYRAARFTIFVSFLEGYGLPVAESLSCGTPVITSSYGSMAEVAAGGGALMIDPRSVDQLEQAMSRLLTDQAAIDRLADEAASRQWPTWETYAETLWRELVESIRGGSEPVRPSSAAAREAASQRS